MSKREQIIELYVRLHNDQRVHIENILDYDYENQEEHDQWMKEATVEEIVDWVESFDVEEFDEY